MTVSRRAFSAGLATLGAGAPFITRGQTGPIRIGWISNMTGQSSAYGLAFNAGMRAAVKEINGAGGVMGRQLEVLVRDTASDPSKAVNATAELAQREKVHAIWGPSSSGETLAAVAVMARHGIPNLTPGQLDQIIDPVKYPNIFRIAPKFSDTIVAVGNYIRNVQKISDVATIGDNTAIGLTSIDLQQKVITQGGGKVVYSAQVDASQPNLTPDLLRARSAGAKVIAAWTASPAIMARLMNARAEVGWDVPIVGHPSLGSGEVKNLLASPKNWENVYAQNFRNCCFDGQGQLPSATKAFIERVSSEIKISDTLMYWLANSYDGIHVMAKAIATARSTEPRSVVAALNSMSHSGVLGNWNWSPTNHNGLPVTALVMAKANSLRDGTFELAPGYA